MIDYVVVGGIAVMYHGVPRTTVDIDLILQLDTDSVDSFVSFLHDNNFDVTSRDIIDVLTTESHCTVFMNNSIFRIDLQGVNSLFDRWTLERAIEVELFGTAVRLATAEDTIVNKLLFASEQDCRDAMGIYLRQRDSLDYDYIQRALSLLNIADRWSIFLKRIDESDSNT